MLINRKVRFYPNFILQDRLLEPVAVGFYLLQRLPSGQFAVAVRTGHFGYPPMGAPEGLVIQQVPVLLDRFVPALRTVGQQLGQGADILKMVLQHRIQPPRASAAQVLQVDPRHLEAGHIQFPADPEYLPLDRAEGVTEVAA